MVTLMVCAVVAVVIAQAIKVASFINSRSCSKKKVLEIK